MIYSRLILSGCVVLMSSSALVGCKQSGSEQSGPSSSDQVINTDTTADQSMTSVTTSKSVPTVNFSDSDINVYKDETFQLDITASNFTVSEGGGISLHFDSSLLKVNSVEIDYTVWDFVNKNGHINNSEGKVSDILFSNYQGVLGNAKIATIEFQAIGQGISTITLQPSTENPFASNGNNMEVVFQTAHVTSN